MPITIVCHSQGNMIGIAAAFLGDRLPERHGYHNSTYGRVTLYCNPHIP